MARDPDRLRWEVLEGMGCQFHRIWSAEWFQNPEAETRRAVPAFQQAVAHIDHRPEPTPGNPPTAGGEPCAHLTGRRDLVGN